MAYKGERTWRDLDFTDLLPNRKRRRVIGMSFPRQNLSLGLEPSILNVLPAGENVEYDIHNQDFNDDDVLYYACSVYISGLEEFTRWAEKHDRNKIVVGGYHPTTFPEDFVRYAHKIVRGLCDDFWATIAQEGQVVNGIVSYNNLPRRDLYDIRSNQQIIPDKKPDDVVVSLNTSIGCNNPQPCDFCCTPMMSSRIDSRPLEAVSREVETLIQYRPKFLFIRDENFTMQKDWRERLAIIHRALPDTRIYLFASASTLNQEGKVAYLAANGVYMVCLGLEDPTESYQKNRHLDEVVALLKKHGIMAYLSFIVNPLKVIGREEGEAFYKVLMGRIEELAPEMICGNFLMPFRGTALWDQYYAFVSTEDYKYYDSKTPFLVRNPVLRDKMRFFMFWYQWQYFASEFYRDNVRKFEVGDTLNLRFVELHGEFEALYQRLWNVRP